MVMPDPLGGVRPWVAGDDGRPNLAKVPGPTPPDAFAVLGVPQRLALDDAGLELKARSLVRELHPDRFHREGPIAVQQAQRHTALVNDALRALRGLEARCRYLVALLAPNDKPTPPQAFLLEMLDWNERLDEASPADAPALESELDTLRQAARQQLETAAKTWDESQTAAAVTTLRGVLGELNYLDNLRERVRVLREGDELLSPARRG
jgi:molecular chaperone HscB